MNFKLTRPMGEPSGKQPEPQPDKQDSRGVEKSKPDWMNQIDAELAFRLVDSILPFEACLYHQILPLSLEGSRLKLGMVNPDDSAALDYVRRILAYMNCSLVPQAIASDAHYAALSAYLQYSDQKKTPETSQPVVRKIAKKLTEHSAKQPPGSSNYYSENLHSNPTFLVDSPDQLPPLPIEGKQQKGEQSGASQPLPAQPVPQPPAEAVSPSEQTQLEPTIDPAAETAKVLEIQPRYLTDLPEVLATLPPTQLLEELLGRIISGGIGRLYLERKLDCGRILWSQNGVLQAVLEDLPLDVFDAVLVELKHFAEQPLAPIQKARQIELERVYQNVNLLFRLRLIPGKHGEEATLQALRGAALKFYHQQHLGNLSQDAIHLAQQLQQKVNDLHTYSRSHSVGVPGNLNAIPEIDRLLKRVRHQLDELQALNFDDSPEEDF